MHRGGDHGFYVRDVRFLDQLEITCNGTSMLSLAGHAVASNWAVFHGYLPAVHPDHTDPVVRTVRSRRVESGMLEHLTLHNAGVATETVMVSFQLSADFADIFDVRHNRTVPPAPATLHASSVGFQRPGGQEQTLVTIMLDGSPAQPVLANVPGGTRAWLQVPVPPQDHRDLTVEVAVKGNFGTREPGDTPVDVPRSPAPLTDLPTIACADNRFARLVHRSVQDLEGLVTPDPAQPDDRFAAAGSPWFLTLFGRDSIWAALMALPFDPNLATGTLRTLARRQGTRNDPETEEQPGKILHEVRHGSLAERSDLPPWYYGSIDATPLFVVLVHEAWRWGVADDQLEPLMDNVEAALAWMVDHGDPDGDGFLEYLPFEGGRGLSNQGWKDSEDGIRFADGRVATAPLALTEVQGYAYAAARAGADLLDHFGRTGGDDWRAWAKDMAERFRASFWTSDESGPYPIVALDGDKQQVDSVASNMGHLLWTGILSADEAALVAERLVAPDMASGYGLRTLSSASVAYNPLSYHCGSVWPHDTAIAVWGLARMGLVDAASELAGQLVSAGAGFDERLPELFTGLGPEVSPEPVPYPSACRPQAWAAGGVLLLVRALAGLEPDVPGGTVHVGSQARTLLGILTLKGIPLGRGHLDVEVSAHDVTATTTGVDLEVVVG